MAMHKNYDILARRIKEQYTTHEQIEERLHYIDHMDPSEHTKHTYDEYYILAALNLEMYIKEGWGPKQAYLNRVTPHATGPRKSSKRGGKWGRSRLYSKE